MLEKLERRALDISKSLKGLRTRLENSMLT
jgi:hypothetical protein